MPLRVADNLESPALSGYSLLKAPSLESAKNSVLVKEKKLVPSKVGKMSASTFEEKAKGEFDHEGVSEHFKSPRQVALFRDLATRPGIRPYLPFNKQAALAKALVNLANKTGAELCGAFIRHNVYSAVLDVRKQEFGAEKLAEKIRKDWSARMRKHQDEFARHAREMLKAADHLVEQQKRRPKVITSCYASVELRKAIDDVERAVALVRKTWREP